MFFPWDFFILKFPFCVYRGCCYFSGAQVTERRSCALVRFVDISYPARYQQLMWIFPCGRASPAHYSSRHGCIDRDRSQTRYDKAVQNIEVPVFSAHDGQLGSLLHAAPSAGANTSALNVSTLCFMFYQNSSCGLFFLFALNFPVSSSQLSE